MADPNCPRCKGTGITHFDAGPGTKRQGACPCLKPANTAKAVTPEQRAGELEARVRTLEVRFASFDETGVWARKVPEKPPCPACAGVGSIQGADGQPYPCPRACVAPAPAPGPEGKA